MSVILQPIAIISQIQQVIQRQVFLQALYAIAIARFWFITDRSRLEDLTLPRILLMAALSIWVGFTSEGVDGFAHLGGFLGGCIIALIYAVVFPKFRGGRS